METEEHIVIDALKALALVVSFALVGVVFLLSGRACASYNPISGEGGGGVLLIFFILPLTAGALTVFARPFTKGLSLLSGILMSVGTFAVAVVGC